MMGKVKNKMSLFKELYYWMCYYVQLVMKHPYMGVEWIACTFFSFVRFFNFLTLWIIFGVILKVVGGFNSDYMEYYIGESYPLFFIIILILVVIDPFLFYSKRDQIITKYKQFSPKKRIVGKIKFWIYVILTILLFFCTLQITQ